MTTGLATFAGGAGPLDELAEEISASEKRRGWTSSRAFLYVPDGATLVGSVVLRFQQSNFLIDRGMLQPAERPTL